MASSSPTGMTKKTTKKIAAGARSQTRLPRQGKWTCGRSRRGSAISAR